MADSSDWLEGRLWLIGIIAPSGSLLGIAVADIEQGQSGTPWLAAAATWLVISISLWLWYRAKRQ